MLRLSRFSYPRRSSANILVLTRPHSTKHEGQGSTHETRVHLFNSLKKSKTSLVQPLDRPLKWYSCGPTVYDASHLGHARNYISQDIIRRILTNYFGYDVHFVMNITDIDDKIIMRTREVFFIEKFASEHPQLSLDMFERVSEQLRNFVQSRLPELSPQWSERQNGVSASLNELLEAVDRPTRGSDAAEGEKRKMHISSVRRCVRALIDAQSELNSGSIGSESKARLIRESSDILGPMLNLRFSHEMINSDLYAHTASTWEAHFFKDMARLNVLPPDTVTRASEYVSQIVSFIEGIVQKGYGYESNGSVYFDTTDFAQSGGHRYNKLIQSNMVDKHASSISQFASDKKSPADFSLWKATKAGEPSWPSPWGLGRPGWHIECSAMASSIFGEKVDIHSGGIDLLFPHHTNELAQSEAYHGCKDWVDCFIHIGHLHIDGLKMSKSLKNFITIEDFLETYTTRQLRLAFLLRSWGSPMDFSETIMTQEVIPLETTLNNFFAHVSSLALDEATFKIGHPFGPHEQDLRSKFDHAQSAFRRALEDSANTPLAMTILRTLISQTNIYINQNAAGVDGLLILGITRWITQMLQMFGLCNCDESRIGWEQSSTQEVVETTTTQVLPYLQALSSFRDEVRKIAKSKSPSMAKELLSLCDQMRDSVLPSIGVQLSDRAALIKFVPPRTSQSARSTVSASSDTSSKGEPKHGANLQPSK